MGKRGKLLKRRRLGLEDLPQAAVEAEEDDDSSSSSDDDDAPAPAAVVSEADLAATLRTLEALGGDLAYFRCHAMKRLRATLAPLAADLVGPTTGKRDRAADRRFKAGQGRENLSAAEKHKVMDRDATNSRTLRADRLARLAAAAVQGEETLAIADGPAGLQPRLLLRQDGEEVVEKAEVLHSSRSCYICKTPFRTLHHFYAALCPPCAALNFSKRGEMCNLTGKAALVTGARVKIGFRIALKLLRCGAKVVACTRFPADCAARFAKEEDVEDWRGRLAVVGADFRDLRAVESLCDALPALLGGALHIIVNNACQTVRRPPQYYAPLLQRELSLRRAALMLADAGPSGEGAGGGAGDAADAGQGAAPGVVTASAAAPSDVPASQLNDVKAWLSQAPPADIVFDDADALPPGMSLGADPSVRAMLAVAPGDSERDDAAFPQGRTDANSDLAQQLDLRQRNSWMLKLEDVSTPEAAEVFAINTLAPFVINSRLKPLMEVDSEALKFIVNVSAMEGKFYRHKSPRHPHTNMAKAALNMMTRTSAGDYAKSKIYMTAADTGWINDEKPVDLAAAHASQHDFQTPLDEIDAAARVLDPIIAPMLRLQNGQAPDPPYGVFLKDYSPCEW